MDAGATSVIPFRQQASPHDLFSRELQRVLSDAQETHVRYVSLVTTELRYSS